MATAATLLRSYSEPMSALNDRAPALRDNDDDDDDEVVTITDLFHSKVRKTPNSIWLRYPASSKGKSDYIGYTVTDIDRLADEAARQYLSQGLCPEVSRLGTTTIDLKLNKSFSTSL